MRYGEFLERYTTAQREWRLGAVDAAEVLAALRGVVPEIDDVRLQRTAVFLIEQWAAKLAPAAQERGERAQRIAAEAERNEGAAGVRVARLEQGMRDITAVAAETDDEVEQNAILALNEPLAQ
ncbi:MAG TPA: hypothetical protein VG497_08360, partial [Kribbella sp.]|nr:hypothetical protein [Kribbella sp.]